MTALRVGTRCHVIPHTFLMSGSQTPTRPVDPDFDRDNRDFLRCAHELCVLCTVSGAQYLLVPWVLDAICAKMGGKLGQPTQPWWCQAGLVVPQPERCSGAQNENQGPLLGFQERKMHCPRRLKGGNRKRLGSEHGTLLLISAGEMDRERTSSLTTSYEYWGRGVILRVGAGG